MKIGKVALKSNLMLAPVAGYSDYALREMAYGYGAGLCVTEMVSCKGLLYNNQNTNFLLYTTDKELVKAVQLFGSDPLDFYNAIRLPQIEKFDIIDINMGCPVKKIVSNGEGSALMQNPRLIEKIVKAAVDGAEGRPVTVKFRIGFETGKPTVVDCALAAEAGGAAMITVHGRYHDQFYSGEADHSFAKEVKKRVNIPVVVNGDITNKETLEDVLNYTECDGAMIARAALGKPWIFLELSGKKANVTIKDEIIKHISLMLSYSPENLVVNNMKKHLCMYAKNLKRGAKAVRAAIADLKTLDELYKIVERCF